MQKRKKLKLKILIPILVVALTIAFFAVYYFALSGDSNLDIPKTVPENTFFISQHINSAWGYRNDGYIIDHEGNVKEFSIPSDVWSVISKDLEKQSEFFNSLPELSIKVDTEELRKNYAYLLEVDPEAITTPRHVSVDAGDWENRAILYQNGEYQEIKLGTIVADITYENIDPYGKKIYNFIYKTLNLLEDANYTNLDEDLAISTELPKIVFKYHHTGYYKNKNQADFGYIIDSEGNIKPFFDETGTLSQKSFDEQMKYFEGLTETCGKVEVKNLKKQYAYLYKFDQSSLHRLENSTITEEYSQNNQIFGYDFKDEEYQEIKLSTVGGHNNDIVYYTNDPYAKAVEKFVEDCHHEFNAWLETQNFSESE